MKVLTGQLGRRLQRLEQRLIPDVPMEFTLHFVSTDGEIMSTVVMGQNRAALEQNETHATIGATRSRTRSGY